MIVSDASEFIRMACGRSGSEKDIEQIKKLFHKEHNDDPMVTDDANANQHNSNTSHDDGQRINVLEDDAIRRQAALDTIESWLSCDDYNEAERHIMRAMQSVLYDLPPVNSQEPSGDAVSRQAIDEIKELMTDINGDTVYAVRMSYLRQLPSVNPQEPETEIEELDFVQEHKKIPVTLQVQKYCDRNICVSNEYNGIGCNECEVMAESEIRNDIFVADRQVQNDFL